jgi:MFS family permease
MMDLASTGSHPGLLRSRRFLPLFITQFLGALNDNLFKNALVILLIFQAGRAGPVLVAAAGAIFILPFAIFSAIAGQLADAHDKAMLIRLTKLGEVALMLLATIGLWYSDLALLLAVLGGLGVQAAFFGPLKYGILPQHLAAGELLRGNALIEAATFIAILAGSSLIAPPHGALIAALALLLALAGLATAWRIPAAPPVAGGMRIGWNPLRESSRLLAQARGQPVVWRACLGLSWFWAVGGVFLSEFPTLAAQDFGADGRVVSLLLAMFALGVGAGALLAGRLAHRPRWLPAGALLALSLFTADFAWVCAGVSPASGWHDIAAMLATPRAWRALADLFLVAASGGVFSVPLYTALQEAAAPGARARMIAANTVLNALFMAAAAGVVAGLAALRVGVPAALGLLALLNLAAAALFNRRGGGL